MSCLSSRRVCKYQVCCLSGGPSVPTLLILPYQHFFIPPKSKPFKHGPACKPSSALLRKDHRPHPYSGHSVALWLQICYGRCMQRTVTEWTARHRHQKAPSRQRLAGSVSGHSADALVKATSGAVSARGVLQGSSAEVRSIVVTQKITATDMTHLAIVTVVRELLSGGSVTFSSLLPHCYRIRAFFRRFGNKKSLIKKRGFSTFCYSVTSVTPISCVFLSKFKKSI